MYVIRAAQSCGALTQCRIFSTGDEILEIRCQKGVPQKLWLQGSWGTLSCTSKGIGRQGIGSLL